MVSHDHHCIFIHVPKTAGTSIEKKLGFIDKVATDVQDHRSLRELEPFSPRHLTSLLRRRDPYLAKAWRNRLTGQIAPTREQYRTYYKFTFVRNTWARVFSWYRNVVTNDRHRRRLGLTDEPTLLEFLQRYPDEWGLRSQLYWIRDSRGELPYDLVGRFETLADDFEHVGQALRLADRSLPHLVVGEGRRYTDHYTDDTIDLVARRYRDEIRLFGFEYGE